MKKNEKDQKDFNFLCHYDSLVGSLKKAWNEVSSLFVETGNMFQHILDVKSGKEALLPRREFRMLYTKASDLKIDAEIKLHELEKEVKDFAKFFGVDAVDKHLDSYMVRVVNTFTIVNDDLSKIIDILHEELISNEE